MLRRYSGGRLSSEEEDNVDDFFTEWLFKLVQRATATEAKQLSKFLSVSFGNLVKWYRKPGKQLPTIAITPAIEELLLDNPTDYDVIAHTGCPHATIVNKVLNKSGLTENERRQWNRKAKAEVKSHLKELYEL